MTPDMIAAEIRKRLEGIATELMRQKRLHANVYEKVVSTLAQMEMTESADANGPSGDSHFSSVRRYQRSPRSPQDQRDRL